MKAEKTKEDQYVWLYICTAEWQYCILATGFHRKHLLHLIQSFTFRLVLLNAKKAEK